MQRPVLLILIACAGVTAQSHVHDCSGRHLHKGPALSRLGSAPIAALTAALAGLVPPKGLDAEGAQQVGAVVKSNVFDRPKALVLLNLAGVSHEDGTLDALAAALPGGSSVRVPLSAAADDLVRAQTEVAAANPDVAFHLLDDTALGEDCGDECMAAHLESAAHAAGGILERDGLGASSALRLPGGSSLRLDSGAGRLFGSELAVLHGAVHAKLGKEQRQRRANEGSDDDVSVFQSTLVGLQALRQEAFDSAEDAFDAATAALAGVVRSMASEVEAAYGTDVVYQITLLGNAPTVTGGAAGAAPSDSLAAWKQAARRSLLQVGSADSTAPLSAPPVRQNGTEADGKAFATKATSYGVALLLIYATMAILYAMTNMPFKQDTLLYGRPKAE